MSLAGALTNNANSQSLPNSLSFNGHNQSSLATTISSSKQVINKTAAKILQRLLDEASQTGDLNLSARNLAEFPSKLASNFDLSDTLTTDLSKNNLTEFPKELCSFDSLEKLTLYSNLIRTIPDIGVYQLKCLKYLDLNSNNLTYVPSSLCNLLSLEVLTINNNKLVSLPEEIGRLDKLIQLDVSCNEITHLPVQIGDMSSLRALNVRRNLLVELPKEISHLKLVSFDCSANRLGKLPLCFREMVTLIDLVVDHNPLEVPPAHVCTKGLLHIMKYLLNEAIKEEKKRGILTEYEINSQFNSFNCNLSAHNQRLSCTAGLGLMVRNSLSKKFSSSSVPSSSMSTVSSSSTSSSSSVSSSSLTSQISTPVFNSNPKNFKQSLIDLSPNQANSTSPTTTPTNNNQYLVDNFQILNINQNIRTDLESGDFMEGQITSSPSSTKSSSSSCSSSISGTGLIMPNKSSIKTHKIPDTANSKVVSIHELISFKSSQYQHNFVKINRSAISNSENQLIVANDEEEMHHCQQTKHDNELPKQQAWMNKSNKMSMNSGLNKRLANNDYDVLSNANNSVAQKNILNDCPKYKKVNECAKMTSQAYLVNDFTEDSSHEEIPSSYVVESQHEKYFQTESDDDKYKSYMYNQQQQQIWVPREDIQDDVDNCESLNSAFTMRRHLLQVQEEHKQIEMLKKTIEQKLKIQLPNCADELGVALSDGVVLCHLINQIFPRAVQIIHVPSLAMPKLSLAKCRKNVENFIDACRRIGLPENDLCCAHDLIEAKNTSRVARTVILLVGYNQFLQQQQQIHQQIRQESLFYNQNSRSNTIGNIMNHSNSIPSQQSQQQTAV